MFQLSRKSKGPIISNYSISISKTRIAYFSIQEIRESFLVLTHQLFKAFRYAAKKTPQDSTK